MGLLAGGPRLKGGDPLRQYVPATARSTASASLAGACFQQQIDTSYLKGLFDTRAGGHDLAPLDAYPTRGLRY